MKETNILETVTERDIDLLVLEEAHVSQQFQSWLLKKILGEDVQQFHFENAWHSISDPVYGETDILLLFKDEKEQKSAILLENKIDAPPQPDQGKRYKLRGAEGIIKEDWHSFKTVILAPDKYLSSRKDALNYDRQISYEEICNWLLTNQSDVERSSYKIRVLRLAIEQNRRGYNPKIDERITKFFHGYWDLANREFPELGMEEPGKKFTG